MISGTSAGGLNAVLIGQGDLSKAIRIWQDLKPEEVIRIDPAKVARILIRLSSEILKMVVLKKSSRAVRLGKEISRVLGKLLHQQAVIKYLLGEGILSTDPLKQLIRNNIDFKRFPDTPEIHITAVRNHPLFIFEDRSYFQFNARHPELMERILMATSAIPILFPNTDIGNIKYSDGGVPRFGDNSPIYPLHSRSCNRIYIVHLSPGARTDIERYPNTEIIDISPDVKLGGILNFSGDHASYLMELGYSNAKSTLQKVRQL